MTGHATRRLASDGNQMGESQSVVGDHKELTALVSQYSSKNKKS